MIKKILPKDAIQQKIIILVTIFITAFLFAYIALALKTSLEKQFYKRIENANSHHHIGTMIVRDLKDIENNIIKLQKIDNEQQLSSISQDIFSTMDKINIYVSVLREGGTIIDQLQINFMNTNNVEAIYQYHPSQKKYNLDMLELGPRIITIQSAISNVIDQIKLKMTTQDSILKRNIQNKVNIQIKQINSYLLRSFENANKILYDSMQKIINEKKKHKKFSDQTDLYNIIFYILTIISLILLTIHIMKQIYLLLAEREDSLNKIEKLSLETNQIVQVAGPACMINNDRIIYRVNEPFCKFFKKTEKEIVGKPCYDTFHGYLCNTPECLMKRCKNATDHDTHFSHEAPVKRSNGIRQVQIDAYCLNDPEGKMTGIVETILDITERKRAEEKYRSLFAYSQDAIIMIAPPDWKFVDANQQALNMFRAKILKSSLLLVQ